MTVLALDGVHAEVAEEHRVHPPGAALIDQLLENGYYIHASNLYNEVATLLSDKSISTVPTVVTLQESWDTKKKDIENALMDRLLTFARRPRLTP